MMIRRRHPYFRLVDDLLREPRPWLPAGGFPAHGFAPALDVDESADAYRVRVNLPGVKLEDIQLDIHDDVLSLSAESASEESDEGSAALIRERRFGKFSRSLRFPANVDGEAADAQFENGVLQIRLPKAERFKPRQIPVSVIAASA